jgi:hypothetical protein
MSLSKSPSTSVTQKTTKIEIWGGFHNALNSVTVRVSKARFDACCEPYGAGFLVSWYDLLSDYQYAKVERNLCGMSDCQCGGLGSHNVKWLEV